MKIPLLMLVHRIPFPPNKGDKIRSFHLLKHLSERYDIYLATFIDDPDDWQYLATLKHYCVDIKAIKLDPLKSKIKALRGFITGQPLSIPYYANRQMRSWIEGVISRHQIQKALCYSSSMAQYLMPFKPIHKIMDMVDVDSDKWRQYAKGMSGVSRWIYRREYQRLSQYERQIIQQFDATFLVSEKESQLLKDLNRDLDDKIDFYNNGVDLNYFNPDLEIENPYSLDRKHITFTGAMDYWANVDAVIWFVQHVFPKLRKKMGNLQLNIIGSNPSKKIRELANEAIFVSGKVPDIRSYIKYSDLLIAPMQIARGIQNKVLEGLAMGKPVVMTSQAYEGLFTTPQLDALCCDDPAGFSDLCLSQLNKQAFDSMWRDYVIQHYSWESCLDKVDGYLQTVLDGTQSCPV